MIAPSVSRPVFRTSSRHALVGLAGSVVFSVAVWSALILAVRGLRP